MIIKTWICENAGDAKLAIRRCSLMLLQLREARTTFQLSLLLKTDQYILQKNLAGKMAGNHMPDEKCHFEKARQYNQAKRLAPWPWPTFYHICLYWPCHVICLSVYLLFVCLYYLFISISSLLCARHNNPLFQHNSLFRTTSKMEPAKTPSRG